MYRIGVDIGGMSIKIGVVDFWGKILFSSRVKTVSTAEQNVKNIANEILLLLKDNGITVSDISGIGIGCPGLICSETGVVESNSNLGWNEFPIVSRLKSYFNVEIKLSNDANVAALAEVKYGVAKNYKNAIMLTLGTGVGGGIIIDKKLYEGGYSKGAELGHICIKERGEKCGCGRRGCLEAYASQPLFAIQNALWKKIKIVLCGKSLKAILIRLTEGLLLNALKRAIQPQIRWLIISSDIFPKGY